MNLKILISLGLCLVIPNAVFGQTITIADDSPMDKPVSITGTATFGNGPEDISCSISGHNESSKPIITTAVAVKLVAPSGQPGEYRFYEDHFFSDVFVASPQADFPVVSNRNQDCRMVRELDIPRTPTAPEGHAVLLYVEYMDGSVWANGKSGSQIGEQLMTQRAEVLSFLQSLKSAYITDGAVGLQRALAVDQKPGTMLSDKLARLRMVNAESGIKAVADIINKNVATAETRKAAGLK